MKIKLAKKEMVNLLNEKLLSPLADRNLEDDNLFHGYR
jgi:hypothetical protein